MENESEVLGYKVSHCFILLIIRVVFSRGEKSELLECDFVTHEMVNFMESLGWLADIYIMHRRISHLDLDVFIPTRKFSIPITGLLFFFFPCNVTCVMFLH